MFNYFERFNRNKQTRSSMPDCWPVQLVESGLHSVLILHRLRCGVLLKPTPSDRIYFGSVTNSPQSVMVSSCTSKHSISSNQNSSGNLLPELLKVEPKAT